jgi:hypothetical protein
MVSECSSVDSRQNLDAKECVVLFLMIHATEDLDGDAPPTAAGACMAVAASMFFLER